MCVIWFEGIENVRHICVGFVGMHGVCCDLSGYAWFHEDSHGFPEIHVDSEIHIDLKEFAGIDKDWNRILNNSFRIRM